MHILYAICEKRYALGRDKNLGRWRLPLQMDRNEEIGMMWEDCGRLYLWITDEYLTEKNFDVSLLIMQRRKATI